MTAPEIDRLDRIVEDYLGAVSWACADLPPQRRDDLIADLREHIAAARAVLYQPTEAAVRTILDRLGDPAAIAEEARLSEGLGPRAPATPRPAGATAYPVYGNRWMSGPLSPRAVAILIALTLVLAFFLGAFVIMEAADPEIPPPVR
jgi:uncharacterized membrane protein